MRIQLRGGPNHGQEVDWSGPLDSVAMFRVPERLAFHWGLDAPEPRIGQYRRPVRMPSGAYWLWWGGWENEPLVDPVELGCAMQFPLYPHRFERLAREDAQHRVERHAAEQGLVIDDATLRSELDPDVDDWLKNMDRGLVRVRAIAHKPYTP